MQTPATNPDHGGTGHPGPAQRRYCYHCRTLHDVSEMRRLETRSGVRWRCRGSLAAARQSAELRASFGQARSAANRIEDRRRAEHLNAQRRLKNTS